MLKRFLAVLATATLGLGLALGAAMPASAHVPDYKATCASLDVNLYAYSGGTNYVTVTVDNAVVQAKTAFSGSFVKSFTWTTSAAHTFKIEIDATENEWDRLGTNAIAGTSGPCSTVTACLNPLSNTLKNFTMVTTGDVTLNSSSHVTGTIAAGGNVIVSQAGYSVGNNEDGSSLPVVDGKSTGLLVGGKVTLNASDAALKVLAGATRVGDTTGAAITESNRYHPISANSPYVQMSANATLAEVGAAGLWNTTFSGTFTTLAANANTIAAYGASDAQFVTLLDNGGDGKKVKLVEGVTNVLRISASDLSAVTKLFFDGTGASPSATTPFIIDVTTSASSGAVTMKAPVINNVNPRFVLWNFAKITGSATLNLSTGTGNDFVRGSILIPGAAVNLTAGGIEGQVAAKAMTHASGSEIHHFAYSACGTTPPKTVTVSTAPSATPPTCTVDGSLVIPTQANVAFSGGTNGAGPGSYTITAVGTNGYTLTGTASWPIVVKAKGDGVNCEKSTEPTLTVATCDATTGNVVSAFITIPNLQNLSYTIAGVNGGNRLTPGSNVSLGQGNYTVNVAGINGYTNTGPTSYPVNIAAFDCNKAVKPALTVATCDVTTGLLTSAYITIPTTTPGLEYTIAGVNGGQPLSGNVNLGVGTYTVTVAAKSGFTNTGPSSFQIVVAQLTCEKAVQPTLTVAVCQPTTGAFQSAYITIPTTTPGLEYSITGVNGGNALTPGSNVNVPAGTTTVLVTAKTNVRNTGPTSFAIVVPALSCEKAVQPAIIIAACDATTGALTPASVKITNTAPGLEYRIAGINGGNILPGGSTWNLPAGTHTVTVTEKAGVTNTGPASFEIVVASLSCEQAVEPTLTVAECDADGDVVSASLTATTTTPGLTYTIHGSGAVLQPGIKTAVTQGTYIIDVTTAAGVKNTGPTTFTIKVDSLDCNESVEPVLTVAQCDATTGPKSAYLTIPTTTPGLIYSIGGKDYAAGDKVDVPAGPYTVAVRAAAGFTNTGKSSFTGTVPAIDCDSENYVEPTVTPQTCDTDLGGVKNGSLLFALNPDLAYKLDGTLVTTALVSNVAAGPHTITVIPAAGHYIAGGIDTFTVTVPAAVDCDGVYTTPLDPFADPEVCDPFSDTADVLNGSITVVHVAGIQWYIGTEADGADKVAVGTPATVGSVRYAYPAGDYFVFAESKDASITIKPGHTTWPLTVKVPNPTCIPTLGLFEANATATGAVCDAFGDSKGTITILPTPGVSYAIKGGPALTSTTTKVAPGTYTVLATLNVPGGTLSADSWVLTVASTSVLCDLETLAFTGQNLTGYLVMAALLFQAGLALVAVQFIRARRKARHLAA